VLVGSGLHKKRTVMRNRQVMLNVPVTRSMILVKSVVLALVVGVLGAQRASGAQHAADDNSAAKSRPNILFAIADDWSFGHASVYGCKWIKTPGFDRVAKQGVLFTRAYTPNAKCAPSRAIVLTGRNSWELDQACNHWCMYPSKFTSYVESLAAHGYSVGMTGKGWGPGIAKDANGKTRQMAGRPFGKMKAKPPARGISNNDYAGNFKDFVKTVPSNKPWCFWYGTTEPHRGYEYGAGVAKGGKKLSDIEKVPAFWPDNERVRNDMLDYGFEVEHYDKHLVRIISHLEKTGQLENTIVVATSDHGMPFPRCKGQAYDYSNHIPLAIMWPAGIKHVGRVVDDYVSFIDLAPTFIEVAGITQQQSEMQPMTGKSLTDILYSSKQGQVIASRDHVLIGKERHDVGRPNDWGYPIRGIVKNNMLYLRNYETSRWPSGNPETGYLNCDGGPTKSWLLNARREKGSDLFWSLCFGKRVSEELYDLTKDPGCVENLINTGKYEAVRKALRKQMIDELKRQKDPRMEGRGEVFEGFDYVNKGNKNFYSRYTNGEKVQAGWVSPSDFEKKSLD
jgi:N-sulfoglucosamine sulfohydrolase